MAFLRHVTLTTTSIPSVIFPPLQEDTLYRQCTDSSGTTSRSLHSFVRGFIVAERHHRGDGGHRSISEKGILKRGNFVILVINHRGEETAEQILFVNTLQNHTNTTRQKKRTVSMADISQ